MSNQDKFMDITLYSGQEDSFYVYVADGDGPQDFTGWTFDAGVYQNPGDTALFALAVTPNIAPNDDMSAAGWLKITCPYATPATDGVYRGFWVLRRYINGGDPAILKMGRVEIQILI